MPPLKNKVKAFRSGENFVSIIMQPDNEITHPEFNLICNFDLNSMAMLCDDKMTGILAKKLNICFIAALQVNSSS